VLLVVCLFGLQYYYDRVLEEQVFVKVQEPVSQTLVDVRTREDEALHSYRYLDRDKGTIRLPIERAMELLAAESAQGKLKYRSVPPRWRSGERMRRSSGGFSFWANFGLGREPNILPPQLAIGGETWRKVDSADPVSRTGG
jgi:hypothetical protein